MASTVSIEEFGKLQQELMQAKEALMTSEEQARSQQKAAENTLQLYHESEKNLAKANKVIQKSKKHKDMQTVLQQHQEELDELRSQNAGLMSNLAEMSATNEKLEKATSGKGGADSSEQMAKMKKREEKLKAQIVELQKEVTEAKAKYAQTLAGSPLPADEEDGPDVKAVGDVSNEIGQNNQTELQKKITKLTRANKELKAMYEQSEKRCKESLDAINQLQSATTDDDSSSALQEEIMTLTAKAKKKQAAYLTLQDEKEALYTELQGIKEKLKNAAENPSQQAKAISKLRGENERLVKEIEGLAVAKASASAEVSESSTELTELKSTYATAKTELDELRKVADSRKDLVNTLSTEKQELITAHDSKYSELEKTSSEKIVELEKQVESLSKKIQQAKEAQAKVKTLQAEVDEAVAAKEFLTRRQDELKAEAAEAATSAAATLEAEQLAGKKALEEAKTKIEEIKESLSARDEELESLKKETSSKFTDRDVSDRKMAALVKDLKKQLKLEQKKTAKRELELSQQLSASQDALDVVSANASASAAAVAQLSVKKGHSRTRSGVSLRSMASYGGSQLSLAESVSSQTTTHSQMHTPVGHREPAPDAAITTDEYEELIRKNTELQSERIDLKDQVRFLSNKLQNTKSELQVKSDMVMQYATKGLSLESPAGGKTAGGKVSGVLGSLRGNKKNAGNISEVNSKLQNVLEETLMKNIQLQNMVEILQAEAAGATATKGAKRSSPTSSGGRPTSPLSKSNGNSVDPDDDSWKTTPM